MKKIFQKKTIWVALILSAGALGSVCMNSSSSSNSSSSNSSSSIDSLVDFNTEVKPIFNKKCISCHGGVKRQGGFSLLFRSDALEKNESGKPAIVPGDPNNSEMIRRLTLQDVEERMPYHEEPLSEKETKLLTKWIKEGAKWGNHWAYIPVEKPEIPKVDSLLTGTLRGDKWVKNEIDAFTYARMHENGASPVAEADKATLLRRLSLDINGLPAPEEIARLFMKDTRPNAYEKLVDTLLASQHFGERWTSVWMDLARYADTKGYEKDVGRSIWRYRDWLIKAFNNNKPYDEFLIEQLAGDLLPNASDQQFLATAFHRNTLTNDEGGTDNEEFRTAAIIDRVNTTWETLMGTTFACVQCHSHPYDPFRHDEYYKFMAFFNNTRDEDTVNDYPLFREFHSQDSVKFVQLKKWLHQQAGNREKELIKFVKTQQPAINSQLADQLINATIADTKFLVLRNNGSARIARANLSKKTQIIYRFNSSKANGKLTLHLDKPDAPELQTIDVKKTGGGWKIATQSIPPVNGTHDIFFTYTNANIANVEEEGMKFDWFFLTNPFPGEEKPGYDSAYKYFNDLLYSHNVTTTPVMMDNPPDMYRPTHVFERGNWMVKGKKVQPDIPKSLGSLPENAPRNRLGMARWITDKKNPLTSRAITNRIWEQFFGQGLAETLEDLGTQGIPPTHKELLNYLSWKLMHEHNWNLKKLMKEILMSATYRQDSKLNQEAVEKDLFNKFYARGARVRLSAEQLRDQALSISGLLCKKMYGPGVFPYQPEGIWMSPYSGASWKKSDSCDQYRRAVYTYWKRSAPYPSMINFDGMAREVCSARRIRTNTPLQSLNMLNDSVYLEAAQHFARRMQKLGGSDIKTQISKGYELALYKPIMPEKLKVLENLYYTALKRFAVSTQDARHIAGGGRRQDPKTAALVVVASAMMNTDELITKN